MDNRGLLTRPEDEPSAAMAKYSAGSRACLRTTFNAKKHKVYWIVRLVLVEV